MTGQDIVLVLGAYTALVLGAFGMLIKFAIDSKKTASDTNRAVNNRPKDAPTTRELIEQMSADVHEVRRDDERRHRDNVSRLHQLDNRLRSVEKDLREHMKDLDERDGR